jgi:trafficking protein particle complex subunit 13
MIYSWRLLYTWLLFLLRLPAILLVLLLAFENTVKKCRGSAAGGMTLPSEQGIDTIVSQALEEPGQHILRVEVGYGASDGTVKTLRKFYRFQVSNPLLISELTMRTGDSSCFVSIALENNGSETKGGALTISSVEFDAQPGLTAQRVSHGGGGGGHGSSSGPDHVLSLSLLALGAVKQPTAIELYDECGRLEAGSSVRYMFQITATSGIFVSQGIAAGDELGKAVITWHKAMGEMGRMASSPILCPRATPTIRPNDPVATMTGRDNPSDFVVHVRGSGLSVDVATSAANRSTATTTGETSVPPPSPTKAKATSLDKLLPVTVEPMDPPSRMELGVPHQVRFLVVNHSHQNMTVQLQFHLQHMTKGLIVCGPSFTNLDDVPGSGGSATVALKFLALQPGLLRVQGCSVLDLATGLQVPQPPLFNVLVVKKKDDGEEKKEQSQ